MIFERRVVIQQLLTGVFLGVVVRTSDSTGGRAHNPPEQNVDVIKVVLQEQCQRMRFFTFESVWKGGCGLHARSVCCSTVHPTREV